MPLPHHEMGRWSSAPPASMKAGRRTLRWREAVRPKEPGRLSQRRQEDDCLRAPGAAGPCQGDRRVRRPGLRAGDPLRPGPLPRSPGNWRSWSSPGRGMITARAIGSHLRQTAALPRTQLHSLRPANSRKRARLGTDQVMASISGEVLVARASPRGDPFSR